MICFADVLNMLEYNQSEFIYINDVHHCWIISFILMDHYIHITNEDQTFDTFIKLLHNEGIIPKFRQLQCKKAPTRATRGNKYKKV